MTRQIYWIEFYLLSVFSGFCSLVILSQLWLPTVQLVLQADWQVLLHSPQPVIFLALGADIVLIIVCSSGICKLLFNYNWRQEKMQAILILFTNLSTFDNFDKILNVKDAGSSMRTMKTRKSLQWRKWLRVDAAQRRNATHIYRLSSASDIDGDYTRNRSAYHA